MTKQKNGADPHISRKILSNEENAKEYLILLEKEIGVHIPKNRNNKVSLSGQNLWDFIENTWKNEISKNLIRDIFRRTEKYDNGKNALTKLPILISEFKLLFGKLQWGFSQGQCDNYLQSLNNNNKELSSKEKDEIASNAIIKNRRLKEINTLRNDYIEYLLFELNDNIIPTLKHNSGVDFFIVMNDTIKKWDQKVSKSATSQFEKDFSPNWKQYAIEHPEKVAEYLYMYQDEGRFGADNRILVVYLDEEINDNNIRKTISGINLDSPYKINFTYKHSKMANSTSYCVECFVILLY